MNELTNEEKNLIKDVLKHIGRGTLRTRIYAGACKMDVSKFNQLADSIFVKLGNGRLTIES